MATSKQLRFLVAAIPQSTVIRVKVTGSNPWKMIVHKQEWSHDQNSVRKMNNSRTGISISGHSGSEKDRNSPGAESSPRYAEAVTI